VFGGDAGRFRVVVGVPRGGGRAVSGRLRGSRPPADDRVAFGTAIGHVGPGDWGAGSQ